MNTEPIINAHRQALQADADAHRARQLRDHLIADYRDAGGNLTHLAAELGIARGSLMQRLQLLAQEETE